MISSGSHSGESTMTPEDVEGQIAKLLNKAAREDNQERLDSSQRNPFLACFGKEQEQFPPAKEELTYILLIQLR
jgi:hypothetical protein